jgi:hypothetical protein
MERFKIIWTDCGEKQTSFYSAYDAGHAEEKFWDSLMDWQGDEKGIEIISISKTESIKKRIEKFYK